MDGLHMVPLASARSGFEAQILAARLGAEGILWQLRGGSADSVYPVGSVDVLVAASDLERARDLLEALEEPDLVDDLSSSVDARSSLLGRDLTEWWMAAAVVTLLVVFVALRMFTL